MKKSKGASRTNLIVNVCICAIKSLHIYRHRVSTCISLLTNTYAHEQVPVYAVSCLGKYVQMDCAMCACLQAVFQSLIMEECAHPTYTQCLEPFMSSPFAKG